MVWGQPFCAQLQGCLWGSRTRESAVPRGTPFPSHVHLCGSTDFIMTWQAEMRVELGPLIEMERWEMINPVQKHSAAKEQRVIRGSGPLRSADAPRDTRRGGQMCCLPLPISLIKVLIVLREL